MCSIVSYYDSAPERRRCGGDVYDARRGAPGLPFDAADLWHVDGFVERVPAGLVAMGVRSLRGGTDAQMQRRGESLAYDRFRFDWQIAQDFIEVAASSLGRGGGVIDSWVDVGEHSGYHGARPSALGPSAEGQSAMQVEDCEVEDASMPVGAEARVASDSVTTPRAPGLRGATFGGRLRRTSWASFLSGRGGWHRRSGGRRGRGLGGADGAILHRLASHSPVSRVRAAPRRSHLPSARHERPGLVRRSAQWGARRRRPTRVCSALVVTLRSWRVG